MTKQMILLSEEILAIFEYYLRMGDSFNFCWIANKRPASDSAIRYKVKVRDTLTYAMLYVVWT